MARRKRRGKRGMLSGIKRGIGTAVNIAFKVVGAAVVGIPLYRGLKNMLSSGDVEAGARDILFDTTGISQGTGVQFQQVASTVVTTVAGLGIAWLGGQISKRFR